MAFILEIRVIVVKLKTETHYCGGGVPKAIGRHVVSGNKSWTCDASTILSREYFLKFSLAKN